MKTRKPDPRLVAKYHEIFHLRQMLDNPMVSAAAKRAATLKIQQLQRIEAKPAAPAPKRDAATNTDARHFAYDKYRFLCAQRAALTRRWGRLSRGEFDLHQALTNHLPSEAPALTRPHDVPDALHNKHWDNFVAAIKSTLATVRDLPAQGI